MDGCANGPQFSTISERALMLAAGKPWCEGRVARQEPGAVLLPEGVAERVPRDSPQLGVTEPEDPHR